MSQTKSEFMIRARLAQDKLVEQFIDHPDVSLIDIGYPIRSGKIGKEPVLRIHVREHWVKARQEERVAFPGQVDGIPVVILFGDYQLENDLPRSDPGKA